MPVLQKKEVLKKKEQSSRREKKEEGKAKWRSSGTIWKGSEFGTSGHDRHTPAVME
jgi:hypothetical protein